jgi:hypothetical protein
MTNPKKSRCDCHCHDKTCSLTHDSEKTCLCQPDRQEKEEQCACGDVIDEEGANGQCWICKDFKPNQKNKENLEKPKIAPASPLSDQEDVLKEVGKEIVICAAVKAKNGKVFRGHRHNNCFATIMDAGLTPSNNYDDQGFITSKNRFVTREEGRKLQDLAGIPSADQEGYRDDTLFSEDLY